MGTRRVDSNVANLPYLPLLPHVLPSAALLPPIARNPKHNIPIPDRPGFPPTHWPGSSSCLDGSERRFPSAAQGLGNSNSNAANAEKLETGSGIGGSQSAAPLAGIIGCRLPSMRWKIHPGARYSSANFVS